MGWLVLALVGALACGCSEDELKLTRTEQQRLSLDADTGRLLVQGRSAYTSGQFAQALALADSAAVRAPSLADVPFMRGLILTKLYRFDEAAAAYQLALEHDRDYEGAHYNLGNNAFFLGQNREALNHYGAERRLLARR